MIKNIKHEDHKEIVKAALDGGDWKGFAIVLTAFTGARINEILSLNSKSFTVSEDIATVKIIASKRGQNRVMNLPNLLFIQVNGLKHTMNNSNRSFVELICSGSKNPATAYRIVRNHFNKLQQDLFGEVKYTLHAFRHTIALRAFGANKNVIDVKVMLGHKSLDATMHYLREIQDAVVLDKVYKLVS